MFEIPPGFRLIGNMDEVLNGFAPLYLNSEIPGYTAIGFHVGQRHCNPRGSCHGGTWATVADVVMGLNVGEETGLSGPTVSMTLDYLGAACPGQWVEGRARVLRVTNRLAFSECLFTAEGEMTLRASGIFRRQAPAPPVEHYLTQGATYPTRIQNAPGIQERS